MNWRDPGSACDPLIVDCMSVLLPVGADFVVIWKYADDGRLSAELKTKTATF